MGVKNPFIPPLRSKGIPGAVQPPELGRKVDLTRLTSVRHGIALASRIAVIAPGVLLRPPGLPAPTGNLIASLTLFSLIFLLT